MPFLTHLSILKTPTFNFPHASEINRIKKPFSPAGLVRQDEVDKLNISDFTENNSELLASNWWLPLAWAASIVKL